MLDIAKSYYEKFCEQYKDNQKDELNFEFRNNGYVMMVYFKYGRIHQILQEAAGIKDSYIFDYGIQRLTKNGSDYIDNKQLFATPTIKSQMQFVGFATNLMNTFLKKSYDGEMFELKPGTKGWK